MNLRTHKRRLAVRQLHRLRHAAVYAFLDMTPREQARYIREHRDGALGALADRPVPRGLRNYLKRNTGAALAGHDAMVARVRAACGRLS